jgi:hypothetical protein
MSLQPTINPNRLLSAGACSLQGTTAAGTGLFGLKESGANNGKRRLMGDTRLETLIFGFGPQRDDGNAFAIEKIAS